MNGIMMTWLELLLLAMIFGGIIYFIGFAFGAAWGAKNRFKMLSRMARYIKKQEQNKK